MSSNGNGSNGSNGNAGGNAKQFVLQQLYIKDMSFESPNSPQVFAGLNADMDTQMNIKNSHADLGGGRYEVVLHLSVHAKKGDQTVFLVELDQAGVFELKGFNGGELQQIIGTHCPSALFPYAREAISSAIGKGGFPPLVLQPINFESLYAQSQQTGTPNA